jgi:hypothetical protein
MSMVTVHGPYTMYSRAVVQNASGSARATVNPSNGLIWTFVPRDQSQPAANYDWAYTGLTGVPATPVNDTMSPTVTFAGAGTATVTLTLNGVAQAPITINAVAGTGGAGVSLLEAEEGGGDEPPPDDGGTEAPEVAVGYDPGAHTVPEVEQFAQDNPDQLEEIIAAEEAGKARVTLLSFLESMRDA